MISVGDPAPDFELPGVDPLADVDDHTLYRLDDTWDGTTVLSFYLFDFNPRCAEQLCGLRDAEWLDIEPDVRVFGISTDSAFSHAAFAREHSLTHPLLSDSDGRVSEQYGGTHDHVNDHRQVSRRSVFVVDADRTVRYAWRAETPTAIPDWRDVGDLVTELSG